MGWKRPRALKDVQKGNVSEFLSAVGASAHGLLDHGETEGDLEEAAEEARVEAVQHALRDENGAEGRSNILEGVLVLSGVAGVLGAVRTIATVAEDTGDDDGSEVEALGEADAAHAAEGEGPEEDGEELDDSEGGEEGVSDRVEGESDGPLRLIRRDDRLLVKAAAGGGNERALVESTAFVLASGIVVGRDREQTPVEAHVGGGDDQGHGGAAEEAEECLAGGGGDEAGGELGELLVLHRFL